MNRDLDLVRDILSEVERQPRFAQSSGLKKALGNAEYSGDQVDYHLKLLVQAGLIEASTEVTGVNDAYRQWLRIELTWEGHDFHEASRDDSRWNTAKEVVVNKAGGMIFEILKKVLMDRAIEAVS